MQNAAFFLLLMVALGSGYVRAENLPGDSITFVSVVTESGGPIQRGRPVPLVVTLRYTLASHDKALLSLSTAQFRNQSCQVGGGELVDAEQRLVEKGSGTLTIHITWSGDTGEHTRGRILGQGSLSFMGMFWREQNGGRGPVGSWERFGLFGFYSDTCNPF